MRKQTYVATKWAFYCDPVNQQSSGTKKLCYRQRSEMKLDNTYNTVHVKMIFVVTFKCVVNIKWSTGDHQHRRN